MDHIYLMITPTLLQTIGLFHQSDQKASSHMIYCEMLVIVCPLIFLLSGLGADMIWAF